MPQLLMICAALLLLVACASEIPTQTPTRTLSGPTLAASQEPFLGPPTEAPPHATAALGFNDPTVAAMPNQAALPPLAIGTEGTQRQDIEITAADGTLLNGRLLQHDDVRRPGVLLLGPDVVGWGGFPDRLYEAGFTVLVMPVRQDENVRVMIEALTSGMADPGSIGVVGAAAGADQALLSCADMLVCDTLVLLSPLQVEPLLNALPRFNPRPILQVVTQEDEPAFLTAQALDAAATGEKLLQPLNNAGRGTVILENRPDVGDLILEWLIRQLTRG